MCRWLLGVAIASVLVGFRAAPRQTQPHVVVTICEDEYRAKETLPPFIRQVAARLGARCTVLVGNETKTSIPGLEVMDEADVLVMFMRRTMLPAEQLKRFQAYFERGGNVLALRTSSHAFQNWLEFDRIVLGGNYHGHYGRDALPTRVRVVDSARTHPIVRGLPLRFHSRGTLYKTSPLQPDCRVLLEGKGGKYPAEPVAWLRRHKGGTVFYTSLGHPDDFQSPAFRRLVAQALAYLLSQR